MANARKGLSEVQGCRGDGTDDKVAAYVRVSIEREASGFIGKKVEVHMTGDNKAQSDKFKQAAREHEADEDEAHWDEKLGKLVKVKPRSEGRDETTER